MTDIETDAEIRKIARLAAIEAVMDGTAQMIGKAPDAIAKRKARADLIKSGEETIEVKAALFAIRDYSFLLARRRVAQT